MDRNPYSPPTAPVADIGGSGAPTGPLYSPRQIYLAAFLGSPVAAAWFMRRNFTTLGDESRAGIAMWVGVGATAALLVLGSFLPAGSPSFLVTIAYSFAIYQYASHLFKAAYHKHLTEGGRKGSTWAVVGVSLLISFAVLAVALAFVFGVPRLFAGK